jgi:hypothetical protein
MSMGFSLSLFILEGLNSRAVRICERISISGGADGKVMLLVVCCSNSGSGWERALMRPSRTWESECFSWGLCSSEFLGGMRKGNIRILNASEDLER